MFGLPHFSPWLLLLSGLSAAVVLGGNLFDMLVNEPNLVRWFPESLPLIRAYWKYKNPGDFFRVVTPVYVVSTLISLAILWSAAHQLYLLLAALGSYLVTQAITVIYFFPKNAIIRTGFVEGVRKIIADFGSRRFLLEMLRNVLTLAASVLPTLASWHQDG